MGIKERIISEENRQDYSEMNLIKELFPDGATIQDLKNGNWQLEADLEDDLFISGGQKIELNLKRKLWFKPGVCFEVEKFVVNSQRLVNPGTKIFILGENSTEEKKNDALISKNYQTEIYFGEFINIIFFKSFKTSAALASYFHEMGHVNKNSGDISKSELGEICGKLHNRRIKDGKLNPELNELFRKYIYDERRASIRALEAARLYRKIFDEEKISELKIFYSKMLTKKIEGYSVFTPDELVAIIDLEKEWHY